MGEGVVDISVGVKRSITWPRVLCLATDKHVKNTPFLRVFNKGNHLWCASQATWQVLNGAMFQLTSA